MRSDRGRHLRRVLALVLVFLFAAPIPQGSGYAAERKAPLPAEYAVKAAFIYNFIKFVEWPAKEGLPGDTIKVCVLGDLADAESFERLQGQVVRGSRVSVSLIKDAGDASGCSVLFVTENQSPRLPRVLERLGASPTLTIGDTDGYAQRGVMINLFLENKRVRFEINEHRARAAGLRISTKLLKLATKVYGIEANDNR